MNWVSRRVSQNSYKSLPLLDDAAKYAFKRKKIAIFCIVYPNYIANFETYQAKLLHLKKLFSKNVESSKVSKVLKTAFCNFLYLKGNWKWGQVNIVSSHPKRFRIISFFINFLWGFWVNKQREIVSFKCIALLIWRTTKINSKFWEVFCNRLLRNGNALDIKMQFINMHIYFQKILPTSH